jgi:hypothetical protein
MNELIAAILFVAFVFFVFLLSPAGAFVLRLH